MSEEKFKDIPGYEGIYQVSNLGNVKSLPRLIINSKNSFISKERILKPGKSTNGYLLVILCNNSNRETKKIHQLVAICFLNHKTCGQQLVVDHINDDKLDNRVENLQVITQRENSHKTQGKYSSNFKGVSFHKKYKKFSASIYINGKNNHLGYFNTEQEANEIYKLKINQL